MISTPLSSSAWTSFATYMVNQGTSTDTAWFVEIDCELLFLYPDSTTLKLMCSSFVLLSIRRRNSKHRPLRNSLLQPRCRSHFPALRLFFEQRAALSLGWDFVR